MGAGLGWLGGSAVRRFGWTIQRVRHRRFGSGTIQGLLGTGRDLKVSVAFDDSEVGVKQLLVAYAGLEREWESA